MSLESVILTPKGQLFRSLSHDIRVLNQCSIATEEERTVWYTEVQIFRKKLYSTYKDIYDLLPHELEHYLDDADIRAKDAVYRERQDTFVVHLMEFIAAEIQKGRVEK